MSRAEKLSRWTSATINCVDTYQHGDAESIAASVRIAAETLAVLEATTARDKAGILASDIVARRSVTCGCEMIWDTPWAKVPANLQEYVRNNAARCMAMLEAA